MKHFKAWWAIHPERDDPEEPLFINRLGNRFNIDSIINTLKRGHEDRLGRGTDREKGPLSLYLFWKSRATQLLKEGILSEIQIKMRLGHKKHSQILEKYYAILDEMDQADAELEYLGIETEQKEEKPANIICSSCGALNEADASRCHRCRFPLTEEALTEERQLDIEGILSRFKEDPEFMQNFAEAVAKVTVKEKQRV
ncbi:MAG: hypothetical protein ACOC3C_08255 [Candidatus Thorarchaeota archaeon]